MVEPFSAPTSDRSEANINLMIRLGQLTAEACQKNITAPYINTDATVQDMNLVRELLGEAKLNYIGYSYGTWLGSWYAKRFPQNTGRMLLDSNMSWHTSAQHNPESQIVVRERVIREVFLPFIARHPEVFAISGTPQQIY